MADTMANRHTKLVVPALGGVYASLDEWAPVLLRVATGLMLVPHGMQKLFGMLGGGGLAGTAGFLESIGYSPGMFWAFTLGSLEFFGGIALALGLFTRPVALLVLFFMINAFFFHYPNGFLWTARGFEVPIIWGAMALYFVIRGGGPMSLDRKLGTEL